MKTLKEFKEKFILDEGVQVTRSKTKDELHKHDSDCKDDCIYDGQELVKAYDIHHKGKLIGSVHNGPFGTEGIIGKRRVAIHGSDVQKSVNAYFKTYTGKKHLAVINKNNLNEEVLNGKIPKFKGNKVEAHGFVGMDNKRWRKSFKSREHLDKWADDKDAEIHGTRDTEEYWNHKMKYKPWRQKEISEGYVDESGKKVTDDYDDAGWFDLNTAKKHAKKHGGRHIMNGDGYYVVKVKPQKSDIDESIKDVNLHSWLKDKGYEKYASQAPRNNKTREVLYGHPTKGSISLMIKRPGTRVYHWQHEDDKGDNSVHGSKLSDLMNHVNNLNESNI